MRSLQATAGRLIAAFLLLALAGSANAPVYAGSMMLLGVGTPSVATGGCAQATTLLARYTAAGGSLNGTESSAVTTMVCSLVTASIITGNMNGSGSGSGGCGSIIDAIWFFPVNNSTNANLNLCSTSYPNGLFTTSVAATFTADQGWTTTSTGVLAPSWGPNTASINFVQNSGSMLVCVLTNDTANVTATEMGAASGVGSNDTELNAHFSTISKFSVNDGTFSSSVGSTTSKGFWGITRTGASARAMYGPAASSTPLISDTLASTGVGTNGLVIGARNVGAGISNPTSHQYAAAIVGAGITGAQYSTIATAVNTAVKAINGGNGCF